MSRHKTTQVRNTLVQASLPKIDRTMTGHQASGLLLRGCVTATYLVDSPDRLNNDYWMGETPVAVYCDVMVYSGMTGMRFAFLRKVLVSQDRGGMHDGRVWKPKAATLDITGDFVPDGGTHPGNWDGDHVLVGFMEDNLNLPIILRGVPHPSQDVGSIEAEKGHRLRVKVADGDPDFLKHHGSFYGLDTNGDFLVDLTKAYAAPLQTTGNEPAPPGNGTTGNYTVKLPPMSKVHVEIDGLANTLDFDGTKLEVKLASGATMKVELKDANAKLTLGDGAVHATIYEKLEAFWNTTVKPKFDAFDNHVHPTGVGPSGVPAPKVVFPSLDTAIKSTKLSFPDA